MRDKTMTEEDVVAELSNGMTVGIGGWGSRRKPMSLVRAILRSDLRDLTVVSYGGPDVGLLAAAGKARKVVFSFVSLDVIALEPNFRRAREAGLVEAAEYDEGMLLLGLQAAAWRLPFLPTRVGLGSDVLRLNPELELVRSPYPGPSGSHEELVAMPAIALDAALVHVNTADRYGNAQVLGPDPYFDQLMVDAADRAYVSCDATVPTAELNDSGAGYRSMIISRHQVDGVVPAPGGAHPTSCEPAYDRDVEFLHEYARNGRTDEGWQEFWEQWCLVADEADYRKRVMAR